MGDAAPTTPATEPAPTTTATAPGGLLAYSRETADGEDVFLRDLASGQERRLTSGRGAGVRSRPVAGRAAGRLPQQPGPGVRRGRHLGRRRRRVGASQPHRRPERRQLGARVVAGRRAARVHVGPRGRHPRPVDDAAGRLRRSARVTEEHCEYADWSPDGTQLVCAGPGAGGGTTTCGSSTPRREPCGSSRTRRRPSSRRPGRRTARGSRSRPRTARRGPWRRWRRTAPGARRSRPARAPTPCGRRRASWPGTAPAG